MDHQKQAVTYYQRDEIVVAGWRNVGFVHWGKQATMSSVRRMGAMSANLLKEHDKISIVQAIPDSVPLPTDDARELLLKMTETGGFRLACLVYVMVGDGFWASAMRSYLTNVHWVRQRPFVPRICGTMAEVATWMPSVHQERTGVAVPQAELLAFMTTVMEPAR